MKIILVAVSFAFFVIATAHPVTEFTSPTDEKILTSTLSCAISNINLPEDQIKKCTIKCTLINVGFFDETNGFNIENIVKARMQNGQSESGARIVAEKCAVTRKESETICEWASRGADCFEAETSLP